MADKGVPHGCAPPSLLQGAPGGALNGLERGSHFCRSGAGGRRGQGGQATALFLLSVSGISQTPVVWMWATTRMHVCGDLLSPVGPQAQRWGCPSPTLFSQPPLGPAHWPLLLQEHTKLLPPQGLCTCSATWTMDLYLPPSFSPGFCSNGTSSERLPLVTSHKIAKLHASPTLLSCFPLEYLSHLTYYLFHFFTILSLPECEPHENKGLTCFDKGSGPHPWDWCLARSGPPLTSG